MSFAFSIFSLLIFWMYSRFFGEALIFWLGIPFSILVFCLFYFLANPVIERVSSISSSTVTLLSLALFLVSIFLLILIPPYEGSILNWVDVPLQNWLRGLASLLLTSFFPGYFLLKIADKKRTVAGGMLIVLSNLLSMLMMFLLAFSTLLLGYAVSSSSVIAVIIINLSLAALYCFTFNANEKINFSLRGHESIVILAFCVVMVGSFAVLLFNMPLTWCDMWYLHSQALEFSKGFPQIFNYPYLFQTYLSVFFFVSGLPSSLTMQLLYLLSFMPLLGFYSMTKQWFTEKRGEKIAAVATFFGILLGFSSLYMLYLNVANPGQTFNNLAYMAVDKTYDSFVRYSFAPYMVVVRWTIGLTVLFSLLYLLKNDNSKIRNSLFVLLVIIGYFGDTPDLLFFIPLLLIWLIFFQPHSEWRIPFSILLGYLGVGIIDFLAPRQIYALSLNASTGQFSVSLPYAASMVMVTLILGVEIAKYKGFSIFPFGQRISSIAEKAWRYAKWLLLYVYLFCIIVVLYTIKDYSFTLYGGFTYVSFFIFPVRWGAVGLLAVLSIFLYLPDIIKNKTLSFFTLVFATGVLLEQTSNYFPLYESDRFAAIICIGASIIAAYGIIRMLNSLTRIFSLKNAVSIFLIFLLIIPSALSAAVYYTHMSYLNGHTAVLSDDELSAIEYIKQHLYSNESVLTFTYGSAWKIGTFAGISYQSLYPYGTTDIEQNIVNYGLLATENPYIITYMLAASNTRYIYVAQEDAVLLGSKYFLINSFLEYLPTVFKSPDVTLYEVPKLTPPSPNPNSSLGIVYVSTNNSLSFDGTDDYVELGNTPLLRPSSISVDFRFKKDGNFNYKFLVDKSKNLWVSYAFMGSDQKLCFMVGIDNGITTRNVTTTTTFQDNRWYHVIGVYDGHRMAIYVNGKLENEAIFNEYESIFYEGDIPLRIGTHVFENNSYFKGSIDYINIYNTTLTEDEINHSFKNDTPKNMTDLVLRLDFNGNLNDNSGNENSVVNHGAAFPSSSAYPDSDSFMPLLTSLLGSKYSVLYADDLLTKNLDMYLSNYTCVILTSDPTTPFPSLLNWASAGNTLAVFNTDGAGFFANAVNFTPSGNLVNVREFNSGKIVYVNIYSLLQSSDEQTPFQTTDLITMIKNALDIPGYNDSISLRELPGVNFNMTSGDFEVTGNLSLSTDLLILTNSSFLNSSFPSSKTSTVTIYGKSTLNIQNASLHVSPSESSLLIKPKNNLTQGQIIIDSKAMLQINDLLDNSTIMNETQNMLNFQAEELSAKSPEVNLSGDIIFDSLYVHVSPYVPLDGIVLQKAEVQGKVKFSTIYISNPLTFFSAFKADGKILNLGQTTPRPTIQWAEVFSSPYNIAFNATFLLSIAIYIVKKRKAKTTINKKIE
jgi:hypothetical protein